MTRPTSTEVSLARGETAAATDGRPRLWIVPDAGEIAGDVST